MMPASSVSRLSRFMKANLPLAGPFTEKCGLFARTIRTNETDPPAARPCRSIAGMVLQRIDRSFFVAVRCEVQFFRSVTFLSWVVLSLAGTKSERRKDCENPRQCAPQWAMKHVTQRVPLRHHVSIWPERVTYANTFIPSARNQLLD